MWSTVWRSKVSLLVIGIVVGVVSVLWFKNSEERYLTSFRRQEESLLVAPAPESPKTRLVITQLNKLVPMAQKFPWFDKLHELLLIQVVDADKATFSIQIQNGQVDITPGWSAGVGKPTLVLYDVRTGHLQRLEQILADGQLSESEMFEIGSVFLVPGLQALYNSDVLYFPGDKRYLKLDNHIQVELLNKYEARDLSGNIIEAKATVANVDGYWKVYPGWQGTPDVRYSTDVNQMIQYYYLINYKFRDIKSSDLLSRKDLFDEYMKLRQDTLTFSSY